MLKVIIDYPTIEEEKKIIRAHINDSFETPRAVIDTEKIVKARNLVKQVYIDERIEQYIADIVFATRYPEQYQLKDMKNYISFGGSPRASINLALAARACAFINVVATLFRKMFVKWQQSFAPSHWSFLRG